MSGCSTFVLRPSQSSKGLASSNKVMKKLDEMPGLPSFRRLESNSLIGISILTLTSESFMETGFELPRGRLHGNQAVLRDLTPTAFFGDQDSSQSPVPRSTYSLSPSLARFHSHTLTDPWASWTGIQWIQQMRNKDTVSPFWEWEFGEKRAATPTKTTRLASSASVEGTCLLEPTQTNLGNKSSCSME